MLTGLFSPSGGNAVVNGHSILTNMRKVRESLGMCPQHNVLFDRLTVKEHLLFFIRLKVAIFFSSDFPQLIETVFSSPTIAKNSSKLVKNSELQESLMIARPHDKNWVKISRNSYTHFNFKLLYGIFDSTQFSNLRCSFPSLLNVLILAYDRI